MIYGKKLNKSAPEPDLTPNITSDLMTIAPVLFVAVLTLLLLVRIFKWIFKRIKRCFKRSSDHLSYEDAMAEAYLTSLKPLEDRYHFAYYQEPPLDPLYFKEKPLILLVGQYSTGKTSLVHYLLQTPIPLAVEGPDPTTHSFSIVTDETGSGDIIYGHELASDPNRSYTQLTHFGSEFLKKVQLVSTKSKILKHVTFVDTPGILSGRKEIIGRGYDFHSVISWFAHRADLILLLYHPMKLDISDEFAATIERLKPEWYKVKILLNMVDKTKMTNDELIRVHGYLRMKLGHMFVNQPESFPIYSAEYCTSPTEGTLDTSHIDRDLLEEIRRLPIDSAAIRHNYLIQRAKLAKIYGYLEGYLYERYHERWFYSTDYVRSHIANLGDIYEVLEKRYNLARSDFPDMVETQTALLSVDPQYFQQYDESLFDQVDEMIKLLPKKTTWTPGASGGIFGEAKSTPRRKED